MLDISQISGSFQVTQTGLLAVLGFFVLLWLVATIILMYHWIRYGRRSLYVAFAGSLYLAVSIVLIGWAGNIAFGF